MLSRSPAWIFRKYSPAAFELALNALPSTTTRAASSGACVALSVMVPRTTTERAAVCGAWGGVAPKSAIAAARIARMVFRLPGGT